VHVIEPRGALFFPKSGTTYPSGRLNSNFPAAQTTHKTAIPFHESGLRMRRSFGVRVSRLA
jgi:hypothetical protein